MQTASHLLMIKPACFAFNIETATSNTFQKQFTGMLQNAVQQKAIYEFEAFVTKLSTKGIAVTVIADTLTPSKPDAIFPNNWISFHEGGQVFLYPMHAANRRLERRADILQIIGKQFQINTVTDLSKYEADATFLEGTGSMVMDRVNKIIYDCISPRTNKELLAHYANLNAYQTVTFNASDENGKAIYHTNVMLTIGETFAVLCSDAIKNGQEREHVISALQASKHEVIEITRTQMNNFAGNMLQVRNHKNERFLILSDRAYNSLTIAQINSLKEHTQLLPVAVPTIESIGGGGARCMIAELFLSPIKIQH